MTGELEAAMTRDGVRAEPFREDFRRMLGKACAEDCDIWAVYANDFGPDGFDASLDSYLAKPDAHTFVLFAEDEIVGMSSYLNIDESRLALEIGGTYYRPKFRGTGINRRIKDMMIRHAFDCGFLRIEFRVDARNARSQAAMTKLGAVREGVMRSDRTTWTGHRRDTVLYSILKAEWPPAQTAD
ncbi:GNAT family N-acetyltransferase [Sphingomonas sp. HDW15A]|uniref:GNAT family N-acetyltransferase n=1 Tax=Sphingomonas sp. HDW15A TaxID=2714942 RepID=UPI001408CF62|nr:GNAT family protein [Sphingomonas sp. HDW15A]QIK95418.1 GNAT family N-acetyltransferase [Sphingomonas sp. HDW15A]